MSISRTVCLHEYLLTESWLCFKDFFNIEHSDIYDRLNHTCILIGSYIWSTRGQTHNQMIHYWQHLLLTIYHTKQMYSMLLWICSVKDHTWHQNMVGTSFSDTWLCLVCHFFLLPHLTSYVVYHCTDARQHGICNSPRLQL